MSLKKSYKLRLDEVSGVCYVYNLNGIGLLKLQVPSLDADDLFDLAEFLPVPVNLKRHSPFSLPESACFPDAEIVF